jgi:hypothetical protein
MELWKNHHAYILKEIRGGRLYQLLTQLIPGE